MVYDTVTYVLSLNGRRQPSKRWFQMVVQNHPQLFKNITQSARKSRFLQKKKRENQSSPTS